MSTPSDGSQLRNVIQELFQTEKAYSEDLNLLVTQYRDQGISSMSKYGLQESIFNRAFSNVASLQQFYAQFILQLEACISLEPITENTAERIADVFLSHINIMTAMYSTYANESINRQEALEQLSRTKGWSDFVASLGKIPDLSSLLIKPIQRMTRYPLLFEQIIKNLSTSSPHSEKLQLALLKLKRMAEQSNFDSRVRQNNSRFQRFSERIEGLDISFLSSVGNDIIFERKVTVSVGKSTTKQNLHATLFRDYLVLAKEGKKDKLAFKFLIRLDFATAQEILIPGSPEYPFEILVEDESNPRFVFYESLEVSRSSWMKALTPLTTQSGLISSRRASRTQEFRRKSSSFQNSPFPLVRSSGQSELSPRLDQASASPRSPLSNSSGSPRFSVMAPVSKSAEKEEMSEKYAKRLKRMSMAAPSELQKLQKPQKNQTVAVRSTPAFSRPPIPSISTDQILQAKSALTKSASNINSPSPHSSSNTPRPAPLVRGRSRSLTDDLNKGNNSPSRPVPPASQQDFLVRRVSSEDAKFLARHSLDALYQIQSAVSVGNGSAASSLLASLIKQLEAVSN